MLKIIVSNTAKRFRLS